ncbi:hypothetical protein BCV69DRAFT_280225 [Microstroma glucosiphilum]|uniref:Potassium channel domain-containing protein n=1 Tax=Pseudomicrostroma glucosiphilum TaxID=1684307 RepID=A0A316UFG2_9BASI|nr:hypothetical protein BCV69DRAFT_280225 [Pseudomicrostroma glucosiphilum]PWN22633.1 hypothetical protein BCV69DRAFT_280225 [Pseudomicrostroma glucosiphilum]
MSYTSTPEASEEQSHTHGWSKQDLQTRWHSLSAAIARFAPLAAALIAPASTLYDIPALTQHWYSLNGVPQEDPQASLILSAVGLATSIIANALLVLRFTVHLPKAWRLAIVVSTVGWLMKTILAVANLITFGALTRNTAGYAYDEGFWCAVLSVILAGFISFLLLFHVIFHDNDLPDEEIRFQGRAFITSELTLFALIALEALIFSQIEGWAFLDGIYFTVVSLLSIGFGDFSPSFASTKVLLFPFELAGIVLISNQISLIVSAVKDRVEERRKQWYEAEGDVLNKYKEKLEAHSRLSKGHVQDHDKDTLKRFAERGQVDLTEADESSDILKQEIARLHRQASHNAAMSQLFDLLWSAGVLVLFWVVGAIIFHFMEGWSMGDAFYFNYVFFLTVGYGDFSPGTPVGKTVFVIWALMAVPIMTNFVVTTIQAVVERLSKLLALTAREKRKERQRIIDEYYESHENYLLSVRAGTDAGHDRSIGDEEASAGSYPERVTAQQGLRKTVSTSSQQSQQDLPPGERRTSERRQQVRQRSKDESLLPEAKDFMPPALTAGGKVSETEEAAADEESKTAEGLRHVLGLASYLEAQARALLIENLPEVSPERLLLQADTNVQISRLASLDEGLPPWLSALRRSIKQDERLQRIKIYRMTYAKFLVAGSDIMKLEGDKAAFWERRLGQKIEQQREGGRSDVESQ